MRERAGGCFRAAPGSLFLRPSVFVSAVFPLRLLTLFLVSSAVFADTAATAAPGTSRLGLQLWSLRAQSSQNPFKALDLTRDFGFTLVETAGTGGLAPERFAQELKQRGLRAVSAHVGYARLQSEFAGAVAEAKALGATYVIIPNLPKTADEPDVATIAAEFNAWNRRLQAEGLRLGYHTHGTEFRALPDGTMFINRLIELTRETGVCFEMDVFWVFHAGADPVALLQRHPGRWRFLHVKDLRRGAARGGMPGRAPATDKVAVGLGQIDWPEVLRAAAAAGVEYFFIEDETVAPLENIPASREYLLRLQF